MAKSGVALWVCLLLAPAILPAEEGSDWAAWWSKGHKIAKGDAFQLTFGGRLMADFTFVSADSELQRAFGDAEVDDGFEFRRARLFFSGTIYERVSFKAEYDFAGGDATFKDVYVGIEQRWGRLLIGHMKEAFGLEELTSSKYSAFIERSLPVEAFAPSRNSGVQVNGHRGDRLNWGLGAHYDADDFGDSLAGDRVNVTGRLAFRPLYERSGKRLLHLGVAVNHRSVESGGTLRFRSRPEAHRTTRWVDTGSFAADGALLHGIELAGVFDRLWFAAEHMSAEVDSRVAEDPSLSGSYVQAGYFLTAADHRSFKAASGQFDRQKPARPWVPGGGRGAWEVTLRVSSLDLDDRAIAGGRLDDLTLGLNWYPNPVTRMMINWVRADREGLGEADLLLVRFAVDF
jgi:phosphate-selective porin OprO/OprP